MTVRLVPARKIAKLPEHVLWVVRKEARLADARVRQTPLGPELRFFVWRAEKTRDEGDLLYSFIFREQDGGSRALGEMAEVKRREFVARGWDLDVEATATSMSETLQESQKLS